MRRTLTFAFAGDLLLVNEGQATLPDVEVLNRRGDDELYLGVLDDADCLVLDLDPLAVLAAGHELKALRALYGRLSDELWDLAGRALQILEWDRKHRFCGACGSSTRRSDVERARTCTTCRLPGYPRISPAVITLVRRGDELLLARGVNDPRGVYSLLAGFVEPGETLEEAVRREVWEEVAIEIENIRYLRSWSWPFPSQLMMAFISEYAGGSLSLDESEIAEASFFPRDALPELFPLPSIARWVIESVLKSGGTYADRSAGTVGVLGKVSDSAESCI